MMGRELAALIVRMQPRLRGLPVRFLDQPFTAGSGAVRSHASPIHRA